MVQSFSLKVHKKALFCIICCHCCMSGNITVSAYWTMFTCLLDNVPFFCIQWWMESYYGRFSFCYSIQLKLMFRFFAHDINWFIMFLRNYTSKFTMLYNYLWCKQRVCQLNSSLISVASRFLHYALYFAKFIYMVYVIQCSSCRQTHVTIWFVCYKFPES